jgi:hypothetical protein
MRRARPRERELGNALWALRTASEELRALAHLYRLKRRDDAPPLDMEPINQGISSLLDGVAKKVRHSTNRIEELYEHSPNG